MKNKKLNIVLFSILVFSLFISNCIWYKIYIIEHEKLKHSIIPTLSKDYFTRQLNLTENQLKIENDYYNGKINNNVLNEISTNPEQNDYWTNQYFYSNREYYQFSESNKNIKDAPIILQNPEYPNGCESASAVMLLNYLGIDITLKEFIENYLITDDVYEKDGQRFGPDPSMIYAGDPSSKNRGWGTFEPVIVDSIKQILKNKLSSESHYKLLTSEYEKLPLEFLVYFSPIIIWVTQDYSEADELYEWFSYDKKNTYSYPKNQHVVLLTGMDEDYYYINDPLKGKNIKVEKITLEKSFNSMGRQFIGLNIF